MEQYFNENQVNPSEEHSSFLSGVFQAIKQSKMAISLFIFAGIVLVFSIVIIILAVANRPKTQIPVPTQAINQSQNPAINPVDSETANWKEYFGNITTTNQSGTYFQKVSIKYPQEWFIDPQDASNLVFAENGIQYKIRISQAAPVLPNSSNTNCTNQSNVSLGQYTADEKVCRSGNIINLFIVSIGDAKTKVSISFDVPPTNQNKYLKTFGKMLSTFKILPGLFKIGQTSQQNQNGASSELTTSTTSPAPNGSVDTSNWKTYTTLKAKNLSLSAFSISYPYNWIPETNYVDSKYPDSGYTLTLKKDNYFISVYQAAYGGAVCIFKDSKPFDGPTNVYRDNNYTEFNSPMGLLRRVETETKDGITTFNFCRKELNSEYFSHPIAIGFLSYKVPSDFNQLTLNEMDSIVKTIRVIQ